MFGARVLRPQKDLNVIVPGIAGMSVMSATFISLAYNLTSCASAGSSSGCAARRCRRRPTWPGIAANAIANTVLQVGVVIIAGQLFFGVPWPGDWFALIVFLARRRRLLRVARRRALARDPELRSPRPRT